MAFSRMRVLLMVAVSLLAGCFLWEPFGYRDSVANGTGNNWNVVADLTSGRHLDFDLRPGTFLGFQRSERRIPMPLLTNVSVQRGALRYSMSGPELDQLRKAGHGDVKLVVYDEGLACLSPVEKGTAQDYPQDQEEYEEMLKAEEG